jgi:hypothetical protein
MDFLDISSLGVAYRYVVKIEQKFKHQNKWEFGSANPQQPKYDKDDPNKQPSENQSKPQEKKGNRKMKKDTGKWCDFHKIPWHNTDECRSKQSLVAEIKDKEPNPDSESDSKNNGRRQIIDADPTATVATTTIQPEEPTDPEEGEHLFHSQMWVKGTPLHFIVDSGSQKNLISTEVVKQLGLSTTPHRTTIQHRVALPGMRSLCQPTVSIVIWTSIPSRMRYYVMFPHWMSVMFFWASHICGSTMLFMSLDPVVSLLLWGVISTGYQR